MSSKTIECDGDQLTGIIAGLVREGLTFKAVYSKGVWIIELTGGF
jgi:hypothetical protein